MRGELFIEAHHGRNGEQGGRTPWVDSGGIRNSGRVVRILYRYKLFRDMLDNVASVFSGGTLANFWVAHYNRDYLNVPRFGDENYEEKAEGKEEE